MKNSTRLAAFLLFLLLFALPGCSGAAKATPDAAIKNTLSLSSYAATLTVTAIGAAGETRIAQLTLQAERAKGDTPIFSAVLTEESGDVSKKTEVYRNGEWYYIDDGGLYYKASDPTLTDDYNYIAYPAQLAKTVPAADWSKSGLGEVTYTASLSEKRLGVIFPTVGAGGSFEGATVTVKVKGDYILSYTLHLTASEPVLEDYTAFTYTLTFQSPGNTVTASPPNGYQNYPEHSFS